MYTDCIVHSKKYENIISTFDVTQFNGYQNEKYENMIFNTKLQPQCLFCVPFPQYNITILAINKTIILIYLRYNLFTFKPVEVKI